MGIKTDAMQHFAKSASTVMYGIPVFDNADICGDSLCTTGIVGVNLYFCANPIFKMFFGASCLCYVVGLYSQA